MANKEGTWLSILEYSHFRKISISTIRRHIKANLVKWKEVDGKYFVWTAAETNEIESRKDGEVLALKLELQRLKSDNRDLREQLNEARMLINLYEGDAGLPPEVPAQ